MFHVCHCRGFTRAGPRFRLARPGALERAGDRNGRMGGWQLPSRLISLLETKMRDTSPSDSVSLTCLVCRPPRITSPAALSRIAAPWTANHVPSSLTSLFHTTSCKTRRRNSPNNKCRPPLRRLALHQLQCPHLANLFCHLLTRHVLVDPLAGTGFARKPRR
jgi:hypothetical protein